LFLKFDVALDALLHLAQLGVTPTVLHAGEYRGRSYVVQPYIEGRHPHYRWFAGHLPELAALVGAYQSDMPLRALASPTTALTHQQHVAGVLDDLEARAPANEMFMQAVGLLRKRSGDLQATALVATHGDPNRKNLILTEDVYLVDWDDLALSDPLRDVGQLLWWYVPREQWNHLFEHLGLDTDGAYEGLYWWVAAESLDVTMKLAERRDHVHAQAFFDDFAAAIEQRANPHAPF
jgi:Ser/Thr protein kinase RdoA (MazF antagonist)